MYKVRANIFKNRLYVTMSGFFHYPEMKECTDKTIKESKRLQRGYDVITDISEFKTVEKDTLAEVKRAQNYFVESGIRYGIRVGGKAGLAIAQLARVGRSVNYVPVNVDTVANAERFLDTQLQTVESR